MYCADVANRRPRRSRAGPQSGFPCVWKPFTWSPFFEKRPDYKAASSRSWKILRSPLAALRKARGETPAARWKVRTKLDRSAKPTSYATSVMERSASARRRAGVAEPRADQVLVRSHAEGICEQSQEMEGTQACFLRRTIEIDAFGGSARPSTAPFPQHGAGRVTALRAAHACVPS